MEAVTQTLSGTDLTQMNILIGKYKQKALLLASLALVASCSDTLSLPTEEVESESQGEMIMFCAGTTENVTRADDARTYYMPDSSRFICRMYYKAQTGSDTLDISGGTDQVAWLKVKKNVGNSLYWNKAYTPVDEETKGEGGIDDYGNDYSAQAFYWQNRKQHAFLAWTDLNRAKTIVGGTEQGDLKFEADTIYRIYTGATTSQWLTKSFEVYGVDDAFESIDDIQSYVQRQEGETTIGESEAFKNKQKQIGDLYDWGVSDVNYHYQHGWQYKYSNRYADYTDYNDPDISKATMRDYGWTQYMMFFDKLPFEGELTGDEEKIYDPDNANVVIFLKDPITHNYLASADVRKDADGHYLDADGHVTTDPALYAYDYYLTDEEGNIKYDEAKPKYVFYYKEHQNKENVKVVEEYPALAFDLRRGEKDNMSEMPDIVQAVEIQAPTGATQESNRVNLYFKHQFSQLQVNIKNAADNSVTIDREDILKVELLGVTEKGYVFTQLDKDGKVKSAAYEEIDFTKYSEQQLKDNQYGTSFEMFELPESETSYGYLKSFNTIAYGQLQAIRITWKESDTEYTHAATYRIPNTELMNLKSGTRYVWNIEIRRGTLAIIRTEIVDWELPLSDEYNGNADGTIQN